MRLFICEKPSQARDIAKVLGASKRGDGYFETAAPGLIVTWCFGHLLEPAQPHSYDEALKRWTLESLPIIPDSWKMEIKATSAKQFKIIKELLKRAKEVVIATDADREGEMIGREVLEACLYRGPIRRLWLSALDDASIRKALANILPGEKTAALYAAGQGRARADWLVGMNLTRAYTLVGQQAGIDGVLSVGRVQTPTLKLVVDRDREIESFVPQDYWLVLAQVENPARPQLFQMRWVPKPEVADSEGRCINESAARTVAQGLPRVPGRVTLATTDRKEEPAPLPYDLSTLQLDCSKRFSMSAQETLDTAQRLYETHKATTYPRTDCQYLPVDQLAAAGSILSAVRQGLPPVAALVANANPQLRSRAWNDSKITAHHAIIPTATRANLDAMNPQDRQVYELIARRFIAQFYPAHAYDQTRIEASFGAEKLQATGRTPVTMGWKSVFTEAEPDTEESLPLPKVQLGDALRCTTAAVDAKQTTPPARFTEGTLILAMKSIGKWVKDERLKKVLKETSGIGTEATRASIIETLIQREYVVHQGKKKSLHSTARGRLLIDALPDAVKDPATTAVWEQALDEIASGKGVLAPFVDRQAAWVRQVVDNAKRGGAIPMQGSPTAPPHKSGAVNARSKGSLAPSGHDCPQCGKALRRRASSGGKGFWWGCTGYPECKHTMADARGKPVPKKVARTS